MAEQLSQIVERVQVLKHEGLLSQIEGAKALHTLRSGKVVENGVGSQAQGDATQEEESINEEVLHQQQEVKRRTATGVASSSGRCEAMQPEAREERQNAPERSKESNATLPYPQRLGKVK